VESRAATAAKVGDNVWGYLPPCQKKNPPESDQKFYILIPMQKVKVASRAQMLGFAHYLQPWEGRTYMAKTPKCATGELKRLPKNPCVRCKLRPTVLNPLYSIEWV
jgi:hypothetical protein